MARQYTEKDIVSIGNDRDRVRQSPTLYLPSVYADGALHSIYEVVDNSVDEVGAVGSVGKGFTLTYDRKNYECTVVDDGAGIPHGMLLKVCTVLATSGKFNNGDDSAYQTSGGVYGHGLKTAVFLSTFCEVTSMRDGKYLTYTFEDGLLKDTRTGKSKEHGTIVRFRLDPKFLRIDELDPKDIQERLKEKSYCFPDMRMTYILLDGGKEIKNVTYQGNTFMDLVKQMKPDTDPIEIKGTYNKTVLLNFGDDKPTDVKIGIDMVIGYSEQALDLDTDAMMISYANSIKTYSGGTHVEGVKQGLVKFFKEVAIPKMSKKDQETTPITPSDITAGLCGVVSIKLSKPSFAGQHKERLTNQEVKIIVRDAVFDYLVNMKTGKINQIIDFVKRVTKGRVASKKVRKKDMDNAFSKDKPSEYKPIVYNMKTTSPELLLVEGDRLVIN